MDHAISDASGPAPPMGERHKTLTSPSGWWHRSRSGASSALSCDSSLSTADSEIRVDAHEELSHNDNAPVRLRSSTSARNDDVS